MCASITAVQQIANMPYVGYRYTTEALHFTNFPRGATSGGYLHSSWASVDSSVLAMAKCTLALKQARGCSCRSRAG